MDGSTGDPASGALVGVAGVGGDGRLNPTFTVPAGLALGVHTVTALGLISGGTLVGSVAVVSGTVAPVSGTAGATVSIAGAGFQGGELIAVALSANGATTPVTNTTATSSGSVPAGTTFTVPTLNPGRYALTFTGQNSGYVATTYFDVAGGGLSFNPSGAQRVSYGGRFTATSDNDFMPGEQVLFYWDGDNTNGAYLGTAAADGNGSVSAGLTIPAGSAVGVHRVTGYGLQSGALVRGTFYVTDVALTSSYGQSGSVIGLNGGGFLPGEQVTVSFGYGGISLINDSSHAADGHGAISSLDYTFTVPISDNNGNAIPAGSYAIVARGVTSGRTAQATPHDPGLTVTPAGSPPGGTVYSDFSNNYLSVQGSGFADSERVRLYLDGDQNSGRLLQDAPANSGYLSYNLTVPANEPLGRHVLAAYAVGSRYDVTTTVGVVGIGLSPMVTIISSTVGVSATGFLPNELVQVLFGDGVTSNGQTYGAVVATGTTDANGNVDTSALTFTVPASYYDSQRYGGTVTVQNGQTYPVYVFGTTGKELARATLTVGARGIALNPTSAQPFNAYCQSPDCVYRTSINVQGLGFGAYEPVQLSYGPDAAHAAFVGGHDRSERQPQRQLPHPRGR